MLCSLRIHPDFTCPAVTRIDVELTRLRASFALAYRIKGRILDLAIPPLSPNRANQNHTDELWQHTCCEAFVGWQSGQGYYEFNFAPSGEWAAYRFNAYRADMTVAHDASPPAIEVSQDEERFELRAAINLSPLSAVPAGAQLRIGLSAVIEERNGRKSYWALHHAPGKPDFHHHSAFTLSLPATL